MSLKQDLKFTSLALVTLNCVTHQGRHFLYRKVFIFRLTKCCKVPPFSEINHPLNFHLLLRPQLTFIQSNHLCGFEQRMPLKHHTEASGLKRTASIKLCSDNLTKLFALSLISLSCSEGLKRHWSSGSEQSGSSMNYLST